MVRFLFRNSHFIPFDRVTGVLVGFRTETFSLPLGPTPCRAGGAPKIRLPSTWLGVARCHSFRAAHRPSKQWYWHAAVVTTLRYGSLSGSVASFVPPSWLVAGAPLQQDIAGPALQVWSTRAHDPNSSRRTSNSRPRVNATNWRVTSTFPSGRGHTKFFGSLIQGFFVQLWSGTRRKLSARCVPSAPRSTALSNPNLTKSGSLSRNGSRRRRNPSVTASSS